MAGRRYDNGMGGYMLSINQLQRLLKLNELLLARAMSRKQHSRVQQLVVHRILVKDTLIESLLNQRGQAA